MSSVCMFFFCFQSVWHAVICSCFFNMGWRGSTHYCPPGGTQHIPRSPVPGGYPFSVRLTFLPVNKKQKPAPQAELCYKGFRCLFKQRQTGYAYFVLPFFFPCARRGALRQMVEDIADLAGLRTLGGHDCQRGLSESSRPGSPRRQREHTQTARLYTGM